MSAQQNMLRRVAATEAANARRATFRARARELGGVTAKTRALIEAEANRAAREAAKAVYLKAGYTPCTNVIPVFYHDENQWMPEQCDRLASPGFIVCYRCQDHTRTTAAQMNAREETRESMQRVMREDDRDHGMLVAAAQFTGLTVEQLAKEARQSDANPFDIYPDF